jgi:hypothetical protein
MHKRELERRLRPVPRAVAMSTVDDVFSGLCKSIGSPKALAAKLLYENGEYDQLVALEARPNDYEFAHSYADDQVVCKFLSKFRDFKHKNLNPREAAIETFEAGEAACFETNRRFRELDLDPSKWDPLMHGILRNARRKIGRLLGKPDLSRISAGFGWGPGANTSAKGKHTASYVKFGSRLDVTSNALAMGHCCINSTPAWVNCQLQTDEFPSVEVSLLKSAFNIVRGNEILYVPKNAKTERTIAKEPAVNSYLQKGFGSEISSLLKRYAGIDLNDQSVNQRLAEEGSRHGNMATLDLKNASGTVSTGAVKFLIREDWFRLLDMVRSKQGWDPVKKCWIYYQQFSSMGNSCTFELESLIFWGIAKATSEHLGLSRISVFGDDVIVETGAYDLLVKVLAYCGFTVNEAKSFGSGPFRESCGKDYFLGIEVRPIYLKEIPSHVESLYKLANSVRRYAHSRNFRYGCDKRFHAVWLSLFERCPSDLRFLIPEGFGDTGFISNWDEATPILRKPFDKDGENGMEGFSYKHLVQVPVKERMKDRHAGYTATLGANGGKPSEPSLDNFGFEYDVSMPFLGYYNLRKMTSPKITRNHTHCWYDLGPWL